ncbi:MAG: hypothetical protein IJ593_06630 [Lachnospiraceae bacterium]|nr:hypothetical protein [Lachnospiraceae bacterium]
MNELREVVNNQLDKLDILDLTSADLEKINVINLRPFVVALFIVMAVSIITFLIMMFIENEKAVYVQIISITVFMSVAIIGLCLDAYVVDKNTYISDIENDMQHYEYTIENKYYRTKSNFTGK